MIQINSGKTSRLATSSFARLLRDPIDVRFVHISSMNVATVAFNNLREVDL